MTEQLTHFKIMMYVKLWNNLIGFKRKGNGLSILKPGNKGKETCAINWFRSSHPPSPHSVGKESGLQCRRPQFNSWIGKIRWRRDRPPTPVFLGFPGGSAGEESACNAGDLGSIPGLGSSPGGGKGYLLQYSGLENSMDCTVHGITNSQTWLSDFHLLTHPPSLWDSDLPVKW